MDQHDHLVFVEPERPRRLLVMDLLHEFDLEKVIATAQRAQLWQAALPGALGNGGGIRARQGTTSFDELGIALFSVTVIDHPTGAADKDIIQLFLADLDETGCTGATGHVAKDLV